MKPNEQFSSFLDHAGKVNSGFRQSTSSLKALCDEAERQIKNNALDRGRLQAAIQQVKQKHPQDTAKYAEAMAELDRVWGTRENYHVTRTRYTYKQLHVGAENELGGTTICLLNPSGQQKEIGYGMAIARTVGASNVRGKEGMLPLSELQVEGASGGQGAHRGPKGLIEVVGGPQSAFDDVQFQCLKIFMDKARTIATYAAEKERKVDEKMAKVSYYPFSEVVQAYNRELRARGGAFASFQLEEVKQAGHTWYLRVGEVDHSTQLNFEVLFKKIGEKNQAAGDVADLFKKKKALFTKCRDKANTMVDQAFKPLNTGPAAIKLHDLNSLFTLYYFVFCVKLYIDIWHRKTTGVSKGTKESDSESKNQYEILPKVDLHQFVQKEFPDASRELLEKVTKDDIKYAALKARMTLDIKDCMQGPFSSFICSYIDGGGGPQVEAQFYEDRHDLVFRSTDMKQKFTGTGKPLPAQKYGSLHKDGRAKEVIAIVFEVRAAEIEINQLANTRRLGRADRGSSLLTVLSAIQGKKG
jgi:hypothetical protein